MTFIANLVHISKNSCYKYGWSDFNHLPLRPYSNVNQVFSKYLNPYLSYRVQIRQGQIKERWTEDPWSVNV